MTEELKLIEYKPSFRPSNCIAMGFETGLTRDERYILNKMHAKLIEKMEREREREREIKKDD